MHHSKKLVLLIYVAIIVLLATSTLLTTSIYNSWWFVSIWVIIALLILCAIVKFKLWHRLPSMLLHCSLLFILMGAGVTYTFGEKGHIVLAPGDETSQFILEETLTPSSLPITLKLDSFVISYHPASKIPRNYTSYLSINGQEYQVSVNKILKIDGYRIYQTSYNNQGETILSVNHDPWGIAITYGGYIMFCIATILLLFSKNGRFRSHLRKASMIIAFMCVSTFSANASSIKGVPLNDANQMSRRQVLYNGRIAPFNTLAVDFVKKITGNTTYAGLSSEQVVASWVLYPESWAKQPFILVESESLQQKLGANSKYLSYDQFFTTDGEYRLKKIHEESQDCYNRDILEVDEKVELIFMLINNQLIKPLPNDVPPLSDLRIEAEIMYNSIPFAKIYFMLTLTIAILFLGFVIVKRKLFPYMVVVAFLLMLFQTVGYVMKWYIIQNIPLSNGPETMHFLSIMIIVIALCISRRNIYVLPLSMLLSGFFALVAHIGNMSSTITPIILVLDSPWLCIHVSVIMISYALLVLIMLISLIAICVKGERLRLMWLNKALLYPGVLLLGVGIFLGAVWANVSWGRYWGWDPKEVWALITLIIYALALHSEIIPRYHNPLFFHYFCVIAFISVLITYFGVNYFLGGLHSYA